MGKFKLNAPYKLDPVPRYEVPFQPDNTEDDSGLVAKANKNGTMIVNKNIPINDPMRKEAESHEDHHIKDMMDGKLDYDDEKVYETISNGEVKEHSREDFKESDKNLAWEKDAYKAGENLEQKDMRPKPNKLSGPPNMREDDTPLAFQKIGSRHESGRTSDENKISHTERFGPSMEKQNRAGRSKKSGVLNGQFNNFYATGPSLWKGPSAITDPPSGVKGNTDGSGNLEESPKFSPKEDKDYSGAKIMYNPRDNNFTYSSSSMSKRIKSLDDLYNNHPSKKFDYSQNLNLDEDSGIDARNGSAGERENYNKEFNSLMKNTSAARQKFVNENNYFKNDRANAMKVSERQDSGRGDGSTVEYQLTPDFTWDDTQNNRDNMDRMEYVQSFYDKDGEYAGGDKFKFGRSAGDAADQKYLGKDQSAIFKNQLTKRNTKYIADNFSSSNKALQEFAKKHPNTFKIMQGD